jgi:hypothetical protein
MSTNEQMTGDSKSFGGAMHSSRETPIGNLARALALLLARSIAQALGTLQRDTRPTNSNLSSLASIVAANLAAGQRRLPPTFEDAPTPRTPVMQLNLAPAGSEERDVVVDGSMLIAPSWRVQKSHAKGWYSQPLGAALFGPAISLIIGLPALLWFLGFFQSHQSLRTAPAETAQLELALSRAEQLIDRGDLNGARELLAAADDGAHGAITFALAETYDPNMLAAWGTQAGIANVGTARLLYAKAQSLGISRAQHRLNALK